MLHFILITLLSFIISSSTITAENAIVSPPLNNRVPLATIGLVADNHYDTFPAGEKAPWQPMPHWLQEQVRRTTTPLKRRYDIAKDKMLEAVDVFNKIDDPRPLTFAVNLGDLVNNALMWNLKPILDAFNTIKAPKFSILGNHDLRGHNDRFGKNNKTQEKWMMSKLGLKEWFYEVDYAPFMFIFLDSMVMEEPAANPKRKQQLQWLKETLDKARELKRVVILFGHISIGLQTSPFAPILKEYPHIVGGFFGHHHKGGYILQDGYFHTTIIQGQIETMTNAYAVLELFTDRMELTGFGRVPTRVMKFEKRETRDLIADYFKSASDNGENDDDDDDELFLNKKVKKIVGKVSSRHGYEELVEGGRHQPAAAPEKVFPKSEILQKPPPLMLNIASYRKPLIAAAEPNPGETRFLKNVYSKWPRRQKTLAPEPAVDLSSYNTLGGGESSSSKKSKKKSTATENSNNINNNKHGVWYIIGGKEDQEHKGKILAPDSVKDNEERKENQNNEINNNKKHTNNDDENNNNNVKDPFPDDDKDPDLLKQQQEKVQTTITERGDSRRTKKTKSSTTGTTSSSFTPNVLEDDDKVFVMIETLLVVASGLVVLFLGFRFKRHICR